MNSSYSGASNMCPPSFAGHAKMLKNHPPPPRLSPEGEVTDLLATLECHGASLYRFVT
jgi:hypothetical protein